MARRAIGIEIVDHELRAVQLARSRKVLTVERSVCVPLAGDELTGKELRALVAREGLRTDLDVVLGIGLGEVTFAHFDTELVDIDHVRGVARFELEHDLPQAAEDIATDASGPFAAATEGQRRYLIAAASQPALDARIASVTAAGLSCELVETEAGALHALALFCQPTVARDRYAAIHQGDHGWILIVGVDGRLAAARALSWLTSDTTPGELEDALARELDLSWRQVFDGSGDQVQPRVLLSISDPELAARLANRLTRHLNVKVSMLYAEDRFRSAQGNRIEQKLTLPLGLALRGVGEGGAGMNLYAFRTLPARLLGDLVRNLNAALVLATLVIVIACASVRVELYHLEKTRAAQKAAAQAAFVAALPDDKPLKPLPQLQARLVALDESLERMGDRTEAVGFGPLQFLAVIAERAQAGAFTSIASLESDGRRSSVLATCASDDAMEQLRSDLSRVQGFTSVSIAESSEPATEGVRLVLKVESGETGEAQ